MSIGTLIKDTLDPLLTGKAHRGVNRSTTINTPYACFYQISGVPVNGITEYLGATRHRWQIDVFGSSPEEAEGVATGVVKTAVEAALNATMTFSMDGQYSEADKSYQYITEYTLWSD